MHNLRPGNNDGSTATVTATAEAGEGDGDGAAAAALRCQSLTSLSPPLIVGVFTVLPHLSAWEYLPTDCH